MRVALLVHLYGGSEEFPDVSTQKEHYKIESGFFTCIWFSSEFLAKHIYQLLMLKKVLHEK